MEKLVLVYSCSRTPALGRAALGRATVYRMLYSRIVPAKERPADPANNNNFVVDVKKMKCSFSVNRQSGEGGSLHIQICHVSATWLHLGVGLVDSIHRASVLS